MKLRQAVLFIFLLISVLVFRSALANPAFVDASTSSIGMPPNGQVAPTETPQVGIDDEGLRTNPALLQVIILLGIVAVLVVFIGVWINRRKVDMR